MMSKPIKTQAERSEEETAYLLSSPANARRLAKAIQQDRDGLAVEHDLIDPDAAGTYESVWDAIADTPEQAANMRIKAELMQQIAALLKTAGWTQAEAAKHCGVTQPRMNDLLRGRISRFSLDALVNIATTLGWRVHVELEAV